MHLPEPIPVWPGLPPGSIVKESSVGNERTDEIGFIYSVSEPQIYPYLPSKEKNLGIGLLLYPGGGYSKLNFQKEAIPAAEWFQEQGIAVFIVKYRIAGSAENEGYHYPIPLQDAQRALRLVRGRASEWGVSTLGVIGFSAGGHLAACVATDDSHAEKLLGDAIDQESARPDFLILIYSVISTHPDYIHQGSFKNFFGMTSDQTIRATPELLQQFSAESRVSINTPPTFIAHALDDKVVNAENSRVMESALKNAGVSVEAHYFNRGGHGGGSGMPGDDFPQWKEKGLNWMKKLMGS